MTRADYFNRRAAYDSGHVPVQQFWKDVEQGYYVLAGLDFNNYFAGACIEGEKPEGWPAKDYASLAP